jgi:SRSO17 transposase
MWAMDREGARQPLTGEARLTAYLEAIAGVLKHASRAASARAYCTALLLPGERKSMEPMAARLEPAQVQAKHQSLHHVVAQAAWDDADGGARAGAAGDRAARAGALLDCR